MNRLAGTDDTLSNQNIPSAGSGTSRASYFGIGALEGKVHVHAMYWWAFMRRCNGRTEYQGSCSLWKHVTFVTLPAASADRVPAAFKFVTVSGGFRIDIHPWQAIDMISQLENKVLASLLCVVNMPLW